MKLPISEQSHLYPSLQPESEKTPSDFWKAVRTNIKLQHQAPPIKPVPRSGGLPVSFAQERLWFLDQLQPGSSIHNMRAAFRLKGSLNVAVLEKSIKEIVLRHEILRTTFPYVDGQPVQSISPEIDLKLPVVDIRKLPETEREVEAQRLALEEAEQPFDLTQGPLMRVKLLRLAEEEYWLLRTVHHIVFDGWSYRIFMRELAILYEAFSTGNPSPLPELPIQYADFAQLQQQSLQGEVLKSQLDYWQQQLSDKVSALELPIDRPRPTVPIYRGMSQSLVLSEHLTEALKALSNQEGVSLFVTLLAAFKTLLYRYTGQEDILICSPVAGRNRVEIKKLIGYFNNLVIMRTDLSGNPSFRDLVGRVSRVALGTYEHQDLPFQKLAELPTLVRMPLSRAMFVLQNTPSQPLELAGIPMIRLDLNCETTNFDLSLSMYEKGKQLAGLLQYKPDLFDTTTITQMLEHFQSLLDSLVTNPDQRLSDLPSFIKTESSQLFDKIVESTFVAPQKKMEHIIAKVWQEVLQLEKVSIHCNFFDLGGSSITAIRLYGKLKELFDSSLSIVDLFRHPTVSGIARYLSQECSEQQSNFEHIYDSAKRQKEGIRRQQQLLKLRRRANG